MQTNKMRQKAYTYPFQKNACESTLGRDFHIAHFNSFFSFAKPNAWMKKCEWSS